MCAEMGPTAAIPRPNPGFIRRSLPLALAAACAITSACVSDGPQPPERQQPRTIEVPEGLEVETVVLAADQYPVDSDNNGFVDTFSVNVFLFPRSDQFPLPIHVNGTFLFELLDRDESPIISWEYSPEEVRQARTRPLPGPSHQFQLNLLRVGTDQFRPTRTQLKCTFIPTDGQPVVANGRPTVNIGPTTDRR